MNLSERDILRRLGAGESIEMVCKAAGLSGDAFKAWWQSSAAARVPATAGTRRAAVKSSVRIQRDGRGVPHIFADNDEDLFFGFGYAMAQDRLWQLDFLRLKGAGRLSEVLGPASGELDFLLRMVGVPSVLDWDLLARTVGIRRIAEFEWTVLPEETRNLISAFSQGINAHMEEVRDRLPIEFDLLDYRPEAWSPVDCVTIEVDFRWYLTGRFPVIAMPEMVRRALGDSPLYRAFLQGESDDASMLWPGEYPRARPAVNPMHVGAAVGEEMAGGSNNWVAAGSRTHGGKPLVASDPHVPFDAVSWWYEVQLSGGSFNVAGMAYTGMPAVMFGRNEKVAWGCTNNICSQRDLYLEKTDPAHPNCFLYDGKWEPARQREEVFQVRGGPPVRKTMRSSRNGPLVDEVVPPAVRNTGPVSLRWLGMYRGGWLTALLGMDRAGSAEALREATRPWHVPTFSVVYADIEGHIGYQSTGRIPLRSVWDRGYRPGWDPTHQWEGLIPFEGMPHVSDPQRGWVATANNRPAPDDFPYPLSGTWSDGHRAARIHQMIQATPVHAVESFQAMQHDALSLRAVRGVPGMLAALAGAAATRLLEAARCLQSWNGRMDPEQVGASLFDAFFTRWVKRVVRERLDGAVAGLVAGGANGLAATLLHEDPAGWFHKSDRAGALRETMTETLEYLTERLGPDMSHWQYGRLHIFPVRHSLSGRGDLGKLLDYGGLPVRGDAITVCNTGQGSQLEARSGANYRMVADLASQPPMLLAVDASSQSGHPGSPHYSDQLTGWVEGKYHAIVLQRNPDPALNPTTVLLEPAAK